MNANRGHEGLRAWTFAAIGLVAGYLIGGWVYEVAGDGVWGAAKKWQASDRRTCGRRGCALRCSPELGNLFRCRSTRTATVAPIDWQSAIAHFGTRMLVTT